MWSAWGFHVPSTTSIVTRLFSKSASFYNPIIYIGMSSRFRKEVSLLLPCTAESREVVHLQHFKNIKPKAENLPQAGSLPTQRPEVKYLAREQNRSNPDSDSGVNSPSETPPEIFHIDVPSHIETSEYCSGLLLCLGGKLKPEVGWVNEETFLTHHDPHTRMLLHKHMH
ncbi:hypothetical protein XENOCAPTIV_028343 [Xenoophorus captivus]|uniref:Uncharacterized protein n=1 Tax=Xenoophorus captivus TaxID=1517983 RepID=A0ABV0R5A1_9TELE